MMQKAMTNNSVEASKSRSSEGIDYRGYRHITPTQAAWAYVNDIKYNYYNIFLTKNGKILYVRLFYCIYIVLFYLYPLRSTFFDSPKHIKSTFHNSPRANQRLYFSWNEMERKGKAMDNQATKFHNYEISRNKCTGSI